MPHSPAAQFVFAISSSPPDMVSQLIYLEISAVCVFSLLFLSVSIIFVISHKSDSL